MVVLANFFLVGPVENPRLDIHEVEGGFVINVFLTPNFLHAIRDFAGQKVIRPDLLADFFGGRRCKRSNGGAFLEPAQRNR